MARLMIVLGAAALLAGCGSPPPPEEKARVGREETRAIRNTEVIGTSGGAVADKVDAALDANDERKQKLDAADSP